MEKIQSKLLENNPKLSNLTLHNYSSYLTKLFNGVSKNNQKQYTFNTKFFIDNYDQVIDFIETKINSRSKKVYYAPLITLLKDTKEAEKALKEYKNNMNNHIKIYNTAQREQVSTETQNAHWVPWETVLKQLNLMWKEFSPLFSKPSLTIQEHRNLQRLVCLACFTLIEPRRNRDWTHFKIDNIDTETDNYLDVKSKRLIFNTYKLSSRKGPQIIECPPNLFNILKQYSKIQKSVGSEYLFSSLFKKGEYNQLSGQSMTGLVASCFGPDSGVNINLLRHSFITYIYRDTPSLKEKEKIAKNMGHSVNQAELYRKIDQE